MSTSYILTNLKQIRDNYFEEKATLLFSTLDNGDTEDTKQQVDEIMENIDNINVLIQRINAVDTVENVDAELKLIEEEAKNYMDIVDANIVEVVTTKQTLPKLKPDGTRLTKETIKKQLPKEENSRVSGLYYYDNAISNSIAGNMLTYIENLKDSGDEPHWVTAFTTRKVVQFGYDYPYGGKDKLIKTSPMPKVITDIISELKALTPLKRFKPTQVIINRYLKGEGISKHIDNPTLFGDTIVCVSFGAQADMKFTKDTDSMIQAVKNRSVYIMTGDARTKWKHEMLPNKQAQIRYSVTFREVNGLEPEVSEEEPEVSEEEPEEEPEPKPVAKPRPRPRPQEQALAPAPRPIPKPRPVEQEEIKVNIPISAPKPVPRKR